MKPFPIHDESAWTRLAESLQADAPKPSRHREQTDACPPLDRFGEGRKHGWTPDEQRHVESCAFCRKTEAMFARATASPLEDAASSDTKVANRPTDVSFTSLARNPARWPELELKIRPFLPDLLTLVGLAETLTETLLAAVNARFPIAKDVRFRDVLLECLASLARDHGKKGVVSLQELEGLIQRRAVAETLAHGSTGESEAAQRLRERLRSASLPTPEDLARASVPAEFAALAHLRFAWAGQAKRQANSDAALFELSAA